MRIHFTVEDLARLRMVASLGPVAESVFALDLFGRTGGAFFNVWRRHVRDRLGEGVRNVEQLIRERRASAELLEMAGRSPDRAAPRSPAEEWTSRRVTATMLGFCQVAVLPYWSRVRGHLESEREVYGRIAITNGVECLLETLHPRLCWNPPVLEIPDAEDRDVHLNGRGLLLSPSLFLQGRNHLFLDRENETGLPALVVSAPCTSAVMSDLMETPAPDDEALGALVGHTRAAALQALTESCTTGGLSERLGISLAGASKHATVLRKAGLITTARNRNTALHTLTSLGMALLHGEPFTAPQPQRN
ncbi:winged helix-turn-helix domain-containing protein [Streptosporangium sp. NPDC006930]|uniref:ArsR/SmtB family transcription factor n=1 Tax=Streptosporangium sp. NPDC006930 TaxID=3154783 RepID=UPI00341BD7EC